MRMNVADMQAGLLERLRRTNVRERVGTVRKRSDEALLAEWDDCGVSFVAASGRLEEVFNAALRGLLDCIVPIDSAGGAFILHEGGVYPGCWLESTGTISAELLSRFLPSVSAETFALFADYQRDDGLMPYKYTASGPAFRQIQLVTPLARSVWNHYRLNGRDRIFLKKMYRAMARFDDWLARCRDTRGTGCVEAFCAFDTGHDLSPRFWHVPDTPHGGDPARCDPDSPVLPFLAPDLTANVYAQRLYLAQIAEELGEPGADGWRSKAQKTLDSLFHHCYDETDAFFYDVDRHGRFVRVQSDVLLRVLACEVGDRERFDTALRRYLLNTRKFFAKYPFTSIAMDDPRFDPFSSYNSWAGPTNFLSLIRSPHAFEHHRRYVELTWAMQPIVSAMSRMSRFPQCISPWTGEEGFTETYSPSVLCLFDFVERLCGIMPTPDGELWFTGLLPYAMDHGEAAAGATGYARNVGGVRFELVNTPEEAAVYRDGEPMLRMPYGLRAVTDRRGRLTGLIGMSARNVEGTVWWEGRNYPVSAAGNERLAFTGTAFETVAEGGVVWPTYG